MGEGYSRASWLRMSFVERLVHALSVSTHGENGEYFRRGGCTTFTIVIVPPFAGSGRVVQPRRVVARPRCVAHVANDTAEVIENVLTDYLCITMHVMEYCVVHSVGTPAL